jgi:predicted small lipoprotein YifL
MRALALVLAFVITAGCGYRGPLYLPGSKPVPGKPPTPTIDPPPARPTPSEATPQ